MATEKVDIDILFNTADAAASVKELKTSLRDLRSAALAAGEGSEEFSKITQKAGELNDKITRVNENIRNNTGNAVENASRGLANLASVGAGAFSAVQGAAVLFGAESKDLQKTLVQLNAAVALSSGLKSLAEAPDIIRDSVNAFKALNLVTKSNEVITLLATGAQTAFAVATGGVTLSMTALKIAIAATGIGLLVVGIGLAVGALSDFSSGVDDAALAQDKLNTSLENTKVNLQALNLLYDSGTSFLTANLNLLKARGATLEDQNKIEQAIFDQNAKRLKSDFDANVDKAVQQTLEINRLDAIGVKTEDQIKLLSKLKSDQLILDAQLVKGQIELDNISTNRNTLLATQSNAIKARNEKAAKDAKDLADKLAKELLEKERDTTTKLGDEILKRQQAIDKAERDGLELSRLRNDEEFKIEEQRILNLKALEDQRKRDILSSENEVDTAKTIAFDNFKKIEEAKFSIAESTASGLGAIGNIITKEGKKQEAVNKGLALVQLAIDTARAIGSLTAASEANLANSFTFGAAGIAQFAAGIARILANIAAAKKILTTPSSSANVSSLAGGAAGTAPTIPTAPATPSATALFGTGGAGNVGGGGNAGQGGAIKVFVVESDITNAQRSVDESRGEIRIG